MPVWFSNLHTQQGAEFYVGSTNPIFSRKNVTLMNVMIDREGTDPWASLNPWQ